MLPQPSRLLQRQMKARKISSSERLQTDQDDPELCRNPPVHLCPRHAPFLSRFYDLKQLLQLNSCRLLWVTKVWKFSWNFPHCKVPANWLELINFPLIKFLVVIGTLMTGNVWVWITLTNHPVSMRSVTVTNQWNIKNWISAAPPCTTSPCERERESSECWVVLSSSTAHTSHQSGVSGSVIGRIRSEIHSLFTIFTLDYSWFFYFFESWIHALDGIKVHLTVPVSVIDHSYSFFFSLLFDLSSSDCTLP